MGLKLWPVALKWFYLIRTFVSRVAVGQSSGEEKIGWSSGKVKQKTLFTEEKVEHRTQVDDKVTQETKGTFTPKATRFVASPKTREVTRSSIHHVHAISVASVKTISISFIH